MSRSAIDATRFTATSPHAYAKPTSINRAAVSSSTNSVSSTSRPSSPNARFNPHARIPPSPIDPKKGNAPPTETPLEKVARLRRARLEQLAAQTTGWDRIVVRGRKWADTAHKITVFGIVGFSSAYTLHNSPFLRNGPSYFFLPLPHFPITNYVLMLTNALTPSQSSRYQ